MFQSTGKCRVDAVEVRDISIVVYGAADQHKLVAKYAMIESSSYNSAGAGLRDSNWSQETIERLRELLASMERDISKDLFEGGDSPVVEDSKAAVLGPDDVPAL